MTAKVYLLGTVHPLPIEKIIKDTERFRELLLREVEIVLMEAPLSKPTTKTKFKAPALYTGLFIYNIITKIAKTISHIISNKGKGDRASFMLFISERVKRDFQKIEMQDLKNRDATNQSIKIVPCHDSDLNKDVSNKGISYVFVNYVFFCVGFLLFLFGISSIILNRLNAFSYLFILISVGIPILFFSKYVENASKLSERNDVAVDYCKRIMAKNYENLLLFYGNDHIEDIRQKLNNSGIETDTIEVEIPKVLKYANKINKKIHSY